MGKKDKSELSNIHGGENELVSIIIPCYNQAQYLVEAAESVICQTYSNIEIIIVNDGSPDNTQEVAEKLQKKYPEKIQILSQENAGLVSARNNGIKEASGKYIVSLDADDKLYKEMINKCVQTSQQHNADIVYTGYQGFGISDRVNMWTAFEETNPLYATPCGALAFIKKRVWEVTGGYKSSMHDGYEDWEFWINAYKHNMKFVHIPEKLYYYRIKEESMYTDAYKRDAYLKAKIVLNHPELYTINIVQNASNLIKKTEDLADFYFYTPQDTVSINKKKLAIIAGLLSPNTKSKETDLILKKSGLRLYALDGIKDSTEIKKILQESPAENVVFYAPMHYHVKNLTTLPYALKNGTIVNATGTLFPYIFKKMRENKKNQLLAYKRLETYQNRIQDKLNNLQHKYDIDTDIAAKKLKALQHKYDIDKESASKKLNPLHHIYYIDTDIS